MSENKAKRKSKTTTDNYEYRKSVVAYLDILGFKELVRSPNLNSWLAAAFNAINTLQTNNLQLPRMKGVQTKVLSDSIII